MYIYTSLSLVVYTLSLHVQVYIYMFILCRSLEHIQDGLLVGMYNLIVHLIPHTLYIVYVHVFPWLAHQGNDIEKFSSIKTKQCTHMRISLLIIVIISVDWHKKNLIHLNHGE